MRIRPEDLPRELERAPHWAGALISGDEPYLILELGDQIRNYLRHQEFYEREVIEVDGHFNWEAFITSTLTLSLFSTRKLVELRFKNRPDQNAQKELLNYFTSPIEDLFILVTTPRLDRNNLRAKWVGAIDRSGVVIPVYPPDHHAFPQWIAQRARQKGLQLTADALELLAQYNEGNLFSVIQELDYLALYFNEGEITATALEGAMTQSSRFKVFDLGDALLIGDLGRIYRIITGLRREGEPETLVNWLLHSEISKLRTMQRKLREGESMERVLQKVWRNKQPLYRRALQRLSPHHLYRCSKMVVEIDRAIKGALHEEPWNAILRTAFYFAGRPILPLSAKVGA